MTGKKKAKGYDLAALDTVASCSEGAEMELENPATREGTGIFLKLLGPDSKEYQDIERQIQAASLERSIKRRKKQNLTEADLLNALTESQPTNVKRVTACTAGWRDADLKDGVILIDGKETEFSKEAARKLYERFPWIVEQALEFIRERGNFIKS